MIKKMLELSATHIKSDTYRKLKLDPEINNLGLCVYPKSDYGFYIELDKNTIAIAKNVVKWKKDYFPLELARLILFAESQNAEVLCLDRDGEILDFLAVYL